MSKQPGEVIKRPLLTEKGTQLSENLQQVLFEVSLDANKIEIRDAVEAIYDVKVESVRTQVVRGKLKRLGRNVGRRPKWKKAIVSLAEGDIDFFAAG
ncbi:MAG: 50S ribosomal protein L23 [Myxococcales bacterium]|nr:50S ribosomal protein L23 [Myxococcales bacterium]